MKSIKTLIVDDSAVFRSQIRAALEPEKGIEIVGSAANGRLAIEKLLQQPVDLVTLDLEMPEMNGLQTLELIRQKGIISKVIVFSAMSTRGAAVTLEALSLGAADFVTKPDASDVEFQRAGPVSGLKRSLWPKIESLFMELQDRYEILNSTFNWSCFLPQAIVIGSSTGGPTALENIFSKIKGPLSCPIFIVQHMPPVFTASLAERIQKISGIPCAEAQDGEKVVAGKIYIAPGNYHMELVSRQADIYISLNQQEQINMVRPAVDPLFASAAKIYKNRCLGVVLTGMGKDGLEGSKLLRQSGSPVLIQDRASCVVFGMPGALFAADEYDGIKNLDEMASTLRKYLT